MCSSFLFLFFSVKKDDTTPKIKIKVEGVDIKQYIIGCQRRKTKNASGCICKCNETSFIENY